MKKRWLLPLVLASMFAFSSCSFLSGQSSGGSTSDSVGNSSTSDSSDSSDSSEVVTGPTSAEVFTLPSTYKIMREQDTSEYYNNGKKLSISLAKNEYESTQLFIVPDKKVSSWNLEISDLKTADGKTLSQDTMEVYAQWYVQTKINSASGSNRLLGWYPDALVPLDAYREYGYDDIAAGDNQAITVTVKTKTDTAAGTYTGTFKLKYNNETENIPVEVKVWDFAVPEENHMISAIGNPFYQELLGGALDNTPEMYEKYNEYFLDHRINMNNLIYPYRSEAQQIEKLREYCNDIRVTAYSYVQEYYNVEATERKMRILIENSDPEHNLLKKNFIYALDEPYRNEEKASIYAKQIVDLLISLANEYRDAELLDDYGLTWEDIAGQDILAAFTCESLSTEVDGLRTYCPSISGYKSQATRDGYARRRAEAYTGANNELADNNFADTWWYTATGPNEPLPNQHMDAELYPLRAANWMQFEYDVKGYLNWGAFVYIDTDTLSLEVWDNADIYNDPADAIKATNGDGYLVYPGLKFGIDAPIPSLRFQAMTDGFEDYEYLYMFDQLVEEYASQYGDLAVDELLTPLYRSIYTDVEAYRNPEAILQARETLASYIEMLASDTHSLVFVGDANTKENSVSVDIYAKTGSVFTMNGKEYKGVECGNGIKITVDCKLSDSTYMEGTLKNGDASFPIKVFLSEQVQGVTTSDSQEELKKYIASQRIGEPSDHITLSLDESLGMTTVKAVFGACLNADSYELASYTPAVSFNKETMFGSLSVEDVETITVNVYNPSESSVDVIFQFRSGTKKKQLTKVTLTSGWNKISVPNVKEVEWAYKDKITDFSIAIDINTAEDVVMYFGDIYFTYKG